MLIAINRSIVNKAAAEVLKAANGKFENLDVTPQELAILIDHGFAFCAQHDNGWRAKKNFTASGFLAVDVDHGLTIEAAVNDPYVQKYGCLLYTTPSHRSDTPRFRILFELEEPITDGDALARALTGLIVKFGADGACKDPCRMFFGSTGSNPTVWGHRLPASEVQTLQMRADEMRVRSADGDSATAPSSAVRSRLTIASNTMVRTAHGDSSLLRELPPRTSIFCPQHIDNRPSAFTLRNRHGVPGLSCSACNATFFVDGGSGVRHSTYDFDYQWNTILGLDDEQYSVHMDENGLIDLSTVFGGRIREWSDDRFLRYEEPAPTVHARFTPGSSKAGFEFSGDFSGFDFEANPDITFVKSPKGTGKTEWLTRLVSDAKKAELSVLLIGHRRALIAATAERIGLTSYLAPPDDDEGKPNAYRRPTRHYAVCVDSLDRLNTKEDRYDLVLIDEVEQVIAHLLSATLKDDRRQILLRFQYYLQQAGAMYLLDADLNRVTIEVVDAMLTDERDRSFQVLLNWWQPQERAVQLHDAPKPDALVGELMDSLRQGERCFVCSNSKEFIDGLETQLLARLDPDQRVLKITSENSQKADVQAILRDIPVRALDYAVILTSPALGTGIDISFEKDASLIDTVYGFFQPLINTHFDIDQQLARVRNPKRIKVWISPQEFAFETDSEAIKAELMASGTAHRELLRIDPDGTAVYDDLYDTVYAIVTASQRASKNRLRENFIGLRRSNGWAIEIIESSTEAKHLGKEIRHQGKETLRQRRFDRILAAPSITEDRFDDLRRQQRLEALKEADIPTMRRYEIESFYRSPVTLELLEADDEGRLRRCIRNFELLLTSDDDLRKRDKWDSHTLTPDQRQLLTKKQLLTSLFNDAGIFQESRFDAQAEIESAQLKGFADSALKHKTTIERLFDVQVRGDVVKKPVRQLQELLAVVGQTLPRRRTEQAQKSKRYWYGLDAERLKTMEQWIAIRARPSVDEVTSNPEDVPGKVDGMIYEKGNPIDDITDPLDRPTRAKARRSQS